MLEEFVSQEKLDEDFESVLHRIFSLDEIDNMMPNSKNLLKKFFDAGYLRGCRYSIELTKDLITKAKQDV